MIHTDLLSFGHSGAKTLDEQTFNSAEAVDMHRSPPAAERSWLSSWLWSSPSEKAFSSDRWKDWDPNSFVFVQGDRPNTWYKASKWQAEFVGEADVGYIDIGGYAPTFKSTKNVQHTRPSGRKFSYVVYIADRYNRYLVNADTRRSREVIAVKLPPGVSVTEAIVDHNDRKRRRQKRAEKEGRTSVPKITYDLGQGQFAILAWNGQRFCKLPKEFEALFEELAEPQKGGSFVYPAHDRNDIVAYGLKRDTDSEWWKVIVLQTEQSARDFKRLEGVRK